MAVRKSVDEEEGREKGGRRGKGNGAEGLKYQLSRRWSCEKGRKEAEVKLSEEQCFGAWRMEGK
jgi:hypothetical protein